MDDRINLAEKLALLPEAYQPGLDRLHERLQAARREGRRASSSGTSTTRPTTSSSSLAGKLTIQLRDRDVVLGPGELFVVPQGVEHCPKADEETHVLLIEPRDTLNTGDAGGDKTVEPIEI